MLPTAGAHGASPPPLSPPPSAGEGRFVPLDRPQTSAGFQSFRSRFWSWRIRAAAGSPEDVQGLAEFKQMLLNDCGSWGPASAMLVLVGFVGLMVAPAGRGAWQGDYLRAAYLVGMTLGTCCGLLALFLGLYSYVFFNGLPLHLLDRAIDVWPLPGPQPFATAAAYLLLLSALLGAYLADGYDAIALTAAGATVVAFATAHVVVHCMFSSAKMVLQPGHEDATSAYDGVVMVLPRALSGLLSLPSSPVHRRPDSAVVAPEPRSSYDRQHSTGASRLPLV